MRDGAVAVRAGIQDPDADPSPGELAEQRVQLGGHRRIGQELGGGGQRAQVRRIDDQRGGAAAGLIVPGQRPGEHGGVAGREQPGQDLLGERVVPGADEHALAGRPGRRRDSEQAGAAPVGRIDPPHAQGRQLAAQPGVRLGREHQRHRHPVLPATCAVPPRLAPIEPGLTQM